MEVPVNRAVFIDKDGTLLRDDPFNVDPSRIEFYPEVVESLKLMTLHGFLAFIVSNQSGVAKGYFSESDLKELASTLRGIFREQGIELSGFYYCPHDPEGIVDVYTVNCRCRKPNPGLILEAARDFNIELGESWMIGDILNDVEAGNRAGCRSILVDRKNETEWLINAWRKPDFVARNLFDAAERIVGYKRPVPEYL